MLKKQYELFLDSFSFACSKTQRAWYQRCGHCAYKAMDLNPEREYISRLLPVFSGDHILVSTRWLSNQDTADVVRLAHSKKPEGGRTKFAKGKSLSSEGCYVWRFWNRYSKINLVMIQYSNWQSIRQAVTYRFDECRRQLNWLMLDLSIRCSHARSATASKHFSSSRSSDIRKGRRHVYRLQLWQARIC